jgi:hypothetical protein
MHLTTLHYTILSLLALTSLTTARKPSNAVLLSNVQTLTLRKDAYTSHRRVSAIPQLKCIGGDGCRHYQVDIMRCKNMGSDYNDQDIQWTCSASLPEEFRLGATDVICEGYDNPDDPYILKGSCGVEYRLYLTDLGEEKYGAPGYFSWGGKEKTSDWAANLFYILWLGALAWIIYALYNSWRRAPAGPRPANRAGNAGGFWGSWGGGGGGGGPPYDPPPPYPGSYPKPYGSSAEGWRPGFWSGMLGGAAAGYMAGNRENRQEIPPRNNGWFGGGNEGGGWGNGGGWGAGPSRPVTRSRSSPSPSATRHESTGFGSTRRR